EMPGESLPIVTVVRPDADGLPWKIVCTNGARDERLVLWITARGHTVADVAWSRRADAPGALLMLAEVVRRGHPERRALLQLARPRARSVRAAHLARHAAGGGRARARARDGALFRGPRSARAAALDHAGRLRLHGRARRRSGVCARAAAAHPSGRPDRGRGRD